MKTLIIKGSPESGKTKIGGLFEDKNTIYVDGRISMNIFLFSSCKKTTKTIIIDDIKNKKDLKSFKSIITKRGEITVNKRGENPFDIKIDTLILICDFL
jgi:hypothetical protein